MRTLDNAMTQAIPRIRPAYNGEPIEPEPLEAKDYSTYYRSIVILMVFLLATLTALTVVEFWGANQAAQMNQLQRCMARINPDSNTNYQLETYKCMNAN